MFSIVVILLACGSEEPGSSTNSNTLPGIDVVTTIYPVTYFAERIGGEYVSVNSLVKPGVEAHDFEPGPSDIAALATADLVVYNHPSFEIWMADGLDATSNSSRVVVEAAADVFGVEGEDPHVWLNPVKAGAMAAKIRDGLITANPQLTDTFSTNAKVLIAELESLNEVLLRRLAICDRAEIVASHLAYGHLAEPLGVRQIGLSGISAESETSARRLADVIEEMKLLNLAYILQEPLVSSELAETVAAETGAEILELHPLGTLTGDEQAAGDDYFTIMRRNIEALALALDCSSS